MPEFYPVAITAETIKRAPGRILYATTSQTFPTGIQDVINVSTYAAMSGWTDLGATKGGVQIGFNNSETVLTVDQIRADIDTIPDNADMFVQTALSEATLDRLSLAWEGDTVTTTTIGGDLQKQTGFGPFEDYTVRRLAVGFRNPTSGKLALWAFRYAQRAPQDSTITLNSTGDQVTIPVRFKILPDTSISTIRQRFCLAWEEM